MLTFKPGSYRPTLPDTLERDGKSYTRREVAARNIREGDLIAFYDCTGEPGTVGTASIGYVWHTDSHPASGRRYVPEWQRREIHARDWRGTLRSWQEPRGSLRFAQLDRVEVWRVTS